MILLLALVGSTAGAGLLPGGGPTKSDCYVEADVTALESSTVEKSKKVTCRDGDPCDRAGGHGRTPE